MVEGIGMKFGTGLDYGLNYFYKCVKQHTEVSIV